jgi:polyhydroxyalkanoate synthesis regulator phasin
MIHRAVSLGLGLAVASKEQIEKAVDELVKKGEVSRAESSEFIEELLSKGSEAKQKMEDMVRERVQTILGEQGVATKEDIERLERRLAALEAVQSPGEQS